jgi:quercetin dioxygenase-like cupin family protein
MNRKPIFRIATGCAVIAFAFGLGIAVGQQSAPTENKGVKISPPTTLDLTQEIEAVEGRQLRMRIVTVEPGGVVGLHSHKGRPAVAYVLQGNLTEHVEGGATHERHQGESWTEGKETTHWAENKGNQAAMVLAVDVFKP